MFVKDLTNFKKKYAALKVKGLIIRKFNTMLFYHNYIPTELAKSTRNILSEYRREI